jgi:hypothetical protein
MSCPDAHCRARRRRHTSEAPGCATFQNLPWPQKAFDNGESVSDSASKMLRWNLGRDRAKQVTLRFVLRASLPPSPSREGDGPQRVPAALLSKTADRRSTRPARHLHQSIHGAATIMPQLGSAQHHFTQSRDTYAKLKRFNNSTLTIAAKSPFEAATAISNSIFAKVWYSDGRSQLKVISGPGACSARSRRAPSCQDPCRRIWTRESSRDLMLASSCRPCTCR